MCSPASVSFCDLVRSAPPKDHTRIVDRATGSCEQPSGKLAPRCDGFANVGFREAVPDAPALANDRNRRKPEARDFATDFRSAPIPVVAPTRIELSGSALAVIRRYGTDHPDWAFLNSRSPAFVLILPAATCNPSCGRERLG